jgi:hypothetical protein
MYLLHRRTFENVLPVDSVVVGLFYVLEGLFEGLFY